MRARILNAREQLKVYTEENPPLEADDVVAGCARQL